MSIDINHTEQETLNTQEREVIDDLILQNRTLDALIKGLTEDIETFKTTTGEHSSAPDIVRFTMQLNIMRDKKTRNLSAINEIIKKNKKNSLDENHE
jgi:hypothetical protein